MDFVLFFFFWLFCFSFLVLTSSSNESHCSLTRHLSLQDAVISIAVIHHISTPERRLEALRELYRVARPGGVILVYVWSFEEGVSVKPLHVSPSCLIASFLFDFFFFFFPN